MKWMSYYLKILCDAKDSGKPVKLVKNFLYVISK